MTEKELGKLKRPDLLALLVAQAREAAALQERLEETEHSLAQEVQQNERLREKLNDKDEQIERLREKLNDKDELMERLKERLNEKDEQIERLKSRLDEKDRRLTLLGAQVEELISGQFLSMDGAQSLTEVSVKIELMLRAAQKAADRYLGEIRETV